MRLEAYKTGSKFELRPPERSAEWAGYHSIRQRAIFAEHLPELDYRTDHPDETAEGNQPLCLYRNGTLVGAIRVDFLDGEKAAFRLLAIDPACQRQGYGSVALMLAEQFAKAHGRMRVVLHAHRSVLFFYARNGYLHAEWDEAPLSADSATLGKRLNLGVAQHDGSVYIAAA